MQVDFSMCRYVTILTHSSYQKCSREIGSFPFDVTADVAHKIETL